MKKLSILCPVLLLAACNDPNIQQTAKNLNLEQVSEIGSNLLVNAVKTECENQLKNQEGGVANLVFTADQKAVLCSCVSDELKGNLTAEKFQNIIKDGGADTSVLTSMVTSAMAICTPTNNGVEAARTELNEPKP
ncbi:hypothetical protein ACSF85_04045 [Moraxella bovoculi]|uniref:hypothetical protein n=1 Tax=Moraxella bovoculi TaxID=386891 RepID=UPI003F50C7E5